MNEFERAELAEFLRSQGWTQDGIWWEKTTFLASDADYGHYTVSVTLENGESLPVWLASLKLENMAKQSVRPVDPEAFEKLVGPIIERFGKESP
jgi:hypothetical protein